MSSTLHVPRAVGFALTLFFLYPANGSAQDAAQPASAPAHLAFVDGAATLEREGRVEAAVDGMPFVPGDRLQTTRGRVEVLFPDGTSLAVDEFSTVELQDQSLIRLMAGRIFLTVAGVNDPANAVRYQIDTPSASASTDGPGEYRVALMNGRGYPETELAVFRGYATLATDVGSTAVRAAERTLARDQLAPSQPLPFNSARFDAFDRWASARRDARLGTTAAQYLPRDLHMYSRTFDRHGTWGHHGSYGPVWYPVVPPTWRPYYHGYWSPVPRYGWTWIGYDPWGWPTHHYGRWKFGGGRWFWVPGTVWGGAWVSWASAPGYVAWCPIGFCSGFSFGVSVGYPWGWVVVSRPHFGHKYPVHRHALRPTAIPHRTPFIVQARSPLKPPVAIPRPGAVPRVPASAAVSSRSAATGSAGPPAGARTTGSIAPNQPELGGARAVPRGHLPARAGTPMRASGASSQAAQPAASGEMRARSRSVAPREPNRDGASANRYVPDTPSLGGARTATPRQARPASREPSTSSSTSSTWYPPVTMTRPRAPRAPAAPPQSPAYRSGPANRSEPPNVFAPGAVAPRGARPRQPAGSPPVSAFQPLRPPSSTGEPRAAAPAAPGGTERRAAPTAVPRGAGATRSAPQPSPAQPSRGGTRPAGARSPRNR